MELPLPKVVADVGPGGPLVTAMGGMNSLANDMILRKINQIKKQYAPLTAQAEAASKLAYANLMGPQFLAKIMQNSGALANLTEEQKNKALSAIYQAGSGQGTGANVFGSMGQNFGGVPSQGIGDQAGNALSGWFSKKLQNVFNSPGSAVNPQVPAVMQGIAHVESGGAKNPYALVGPHTGKMGRAIGKYQVMEANIPEWTKQALGQSLTPEQFLSSPDAQEKVAAYMVNKHLQAGDTPQDVGSRWLTGKPLDQAGNAKDLYGTTAEKYVKKMEEGMSPIPEGTYAKNTGNYLGTVKQGEKAGEYRAQALKDVGESQLGLSNSGVALDRMANIVKSPTFQEMRTKIPFFQDKQLKYLMVNGTPEQKKMIGDFIATGENIIASGVQAFGGKPLVREFDLMKRQKISESDPVHVAEGKLQSLITLHDIMEKKGELISDLLKKGYDEAEAVKIANKKIDVRAIEKATNDLLRDKPNEEDIAYMAQKRGISKEEVRKQLKAKGIL